MNKNLLIIGVAVGVITVGLIIFLSQDKSAITPSGQSTSDSRPSQSTSNTDSSSRVLAGTTTPLLDFTKQAYDKALSENKVIFLYFYANWCPICRVEVPNELYPAFNELQLQNVVGLRVNYNDNETDADEKALAKQFGITYQHSKVIIKDGREVLKSLDSWDKKRYITEITKAAQ